MAGHNKMLDHKRAAPRSGQSPHSDRIRINGEDAGTARLGRMTLLLHCSCAREHDCSNILLGPHCIDQQPAEKEATAAPRVACRLVFNIITTGRATNRQTYVGNRRISGPAGQLILSLLHAVAAEPVLHRLLSLPHYLAKCELVFSCTIVQSY